MQEQPFIIPLFLDLTACSELHRSPEAAAFLTHRLYRKITEHPRYIPQQEQPYSFAFC